MFEKWDMPEAKANLEFMPPVVFLKEAQVKAPSMEIQAGLIREAVLNIPALRYECWQQMVPEQRLAVLNALEDQMAEIGLRDSRIVVARELDVPGLCKGQSIIINRELVNSDTQEGFEAAVSALIHEGRHAYQHHNMTVSQVEKNGELVDSWRTNMDLGYDNGTGKIHWGRSDIQLKMQAREVDADAFTCAVMQQLEDVFK